MRRIVPAVLAACVWLFVLALVATGIARASMVAKERKTPHGAEVTDPDRAT